MADNSEQLEENSEQVPTIPDEESASDTPEPAPKRGRGRPKGARDAAPRKPRTRIVENDDPPPAAPPATAAPDHPTPASSSGYTPPSPRTMFRQASEHIAAMQTEKERARRQYWHDAISKSLR